MTIKKVYSAIGNWCRIFSARSGQSMYDVKPKAHLMCVLLRNAVALQGFHRMGDGRIFSKNLRASLFNDDLSNEPNFGRIHLSGQYLQHKNCPLGFCPKLRFFSGFFYIYCILIYLAGWAIVCNVHRDHVADRQLCFVNIEKNRHCYRVVAWTLCGPAEIRKKLQKTILKCFNPVLRTPPQSIYPPPPPRLRENFKQFMTYDPILFKIPWQAQKLTSSRRELSPYF